MPYIVFTVEQSTWPLINIYCLLCCIYKVLFENKINMLIEMQGFDVLVATLDVCYCTHSLKEKVMWVSVLRNFSIF